MCSYRYLIDNIIMTSGWQPRQVTEWLLEQRLFGVPLTYKEAERERRRNKRLTGTCTTSTSACRKLEFHSPSSEKVRHNGEW